MSKKIIFELTEAETMRAGFPGEIEIELMEDLLWSLTWKYGFELRELISHTLSQTNMYKSEPKLVQAAIFLSSAKQIWLIGYFPEVKFSIILPVFSEWMKISPFVLDELKISSLLNQARLVTAPPWALIFNIGSKGDFVLQIFTVLFVDPAAI